MIRRLTSTSDKKYDPRTTKAQWCENKLFENGRVMNNDDCFPLIILNVQIEQQK